MNASELLNQLQLIIDKQGDLDIKISILTNDSFDTLLEVYPNTIKVIKNEIVIS